MLKYANLLSYFISEGNIFIASNELTFLGRSKCNSSDVFFIMHIAENCYSLRTHI